MKEYTYTAREIDSEGKAKEAVQLTADSINSYMLEITRTRHHAKIHITQNETGKRRTYRDNGNRWKIEAHN